MPNPYSSIDPEILAEARTLSTDHRRARGAADSPNAGIGVFKRTKAPSSADLRRLETALRKATKVTPSEAEQYTKGYSRQLTPNQMTFLDQMLKGDTLIHSYEVAYPNDKSTTKTKYNSAWHLSKHPVVMAAMDKHALTIRDKQQMSASQIREYVIERLLHESQNAFTDGTRVRALELLGKVAEVGMFVTRSETTNITVPPGELQATLLAKLKDFFNKANNPAQPLATLTDRRQGLTLQGEAQDVTDITATVRQQPNSNDGHSDTDQQVSSQDPSLPLPRPRQRIEGDTGDDEAAGTLPSPAP